MTAPIKPDVTIDDLGYEDGIRPVLAVPEESVPDGVRLG